MRNAVFCAAALSSLIGCQRAGTSNADSAITPDADSGPRPRRREPEASAAARAAALVRDAESLRKEKDGHGGWEQWQTATESFRAALARRLHAIRGEDLQSRLMPGLAVRKASAQYEPPGRIDEFPRIDNKPRSLDPVDDFPLVEAGALDNLTHLLRPDLFPTGFRARDVIAADRWLAEKHIDMILVAVPQATEVYAEHFLDPYPADGVIGPHIRKAMAGLIEQDVEVPDVLSLLRANRGGKDLLWFAADTHWSPPAWELMAKEVANRLRRYDFAERASKQPPLIKVRFVSDRPADYVGLDKNIFHSFLSPQQAQRIGRAPAVRWPVYEMAEGGALSEDPASPLLVIGNSFSAGFTDALAKAANCRVRRHCGAAQTTQAFADFVREPDLLDGVRVVVWVSTWRYLAALKSLPNAVLSGK